MEHHQKGAMVAPRSPAVKCGRAGAGGKALERYRVSSIHDDRAHGMQEIRTRIFRR
jgi:hypothetical protein